MLPAFPAVAIAAAIVLSKLKKPIATFVVSVIILSSTLFVVMGYIPLLKNEFYDNNIRLAAEYVNELNISNIGVYMHYNNLNYKTSPKTEIYGYVFDYYSNKRVYYDVSESVRSIYHDEFRFNVFNYYRDENYLTPDYDALVVFSDVYDWQSIDYLDVKQLKETLDRYYALNKTFSVGSSGIEENKFSFVYVKA